jgi:hypothetical protein
LLCAESAAASYGRRVDCRHIFVLFVFFVFFAFFSFFATVSSKFPHRCHRRFSNLFLRLKSNHSPFGCLVGWLVGCLLALGLAYMACQRPPARATDPRVRSVFEHGSTVAAAPYGISRVSVQFNGVEWGGTGHQRVDLRGYDLLLGVTLGMRVAALDAQWGDLAGAPRVPVNQVPQDPRALTSVPAWHAVRYSNAVLLAGLRMLQIKSDGDATIAQMSGDAWFVHEAASAPPAEDIAELGLSNSTLLRSQWARDTQWLAGEVPWEMSVGRPGKALPLAQHPVLNFHVNIAPRSDVLNVDANWSMPATPWLVGDPPGNRTAAEFTGFQIREAPLAPLATAGLEVWLVLDVAKVAEAEVPRLLGSVARPFQLQLQAMCAQTPQRLPDRSSSACFSARAPFHEVIWALRAAARTTDPVWRGLSLVVGGVLEAPSAGLARPMRRRWQGGNDWFNFSGAGTAGDSFETGTVTQVTVTPQPFAAPAVFFRAAFRAFRGKRMRNFVYAWMGAVSEKTVACPALAQALPCASAGHADQAGRVDFRLMWGQETALRGPTDLLVWVHRDMQICIDERRLHARDADCLA